MTSEELEFQRSEHAKHEAEREKLRVGNVVGDSIAGDVDSASPITNSAESVEPNQPTEKETDDEESNSEENDPEEDFEEGLNGPKENENN